MNYEIVNLEEKIIIGVTARTGNNAPDCSEVIGGLWQKFMSENVCSTVKNIISEYPVGLYSDYDETTYDVTVGMQVSENANPELSAKIIPSGKYAKFSIEGDVVKDVSEAWNEIWNIPLNRNFKADFEEYLSNDNGNAKINIYISLNS